MLINKTTTLHVHHAFSCISLPSLHDRNVKLPRQQLSLSFPELWYSPLELNLKKIAEIWKLKRDVISAIKFEAARIHFLSDVFVAVAVVVAQNSLLTNGSGGATDRYTMTTPMKMLLVSRLLWKGFGLFFMWLFKQFTWSLIRSFKKRNLFRAKRKSFFSVDTKVNLQITMNLNSNLNWGRN